LTRHEITSPGVTGLSRLLTLALVLVVILILPL
jgi:hypothetical protein